MYNAFFNFQEAPFSITPDPRFIYLSPGHQEAFEHMLYGVEEKKGFILISGDIGAGKTTLTRLLLDRLDDTVKVALIFNTFLNEIELLKAINREFGLPAEESSRESLIQSLNLFLIETARAGGNAVLILDEAQNLSVPVLEQVRMLSNLETDDQKLIQIVLVGQPELARTLDRPDLAQLNQRITVRCQLAPLNLEDTTRYIHHRLSVAGPQGLAGFEPKTYQFIHRFSEGVPRRINALCDRALLVAYGAGSHRIQPDYIRQAYQETTGLIQGTGRPRWFKRLISPAVYQTALAVLLLVLVAYWAYLRLGGRF